VPTNFQGEPPRWWRGRGRAAGPRRPKRRSGREPVFCKSGARAKLSLSLSPSLLWALLSYFTLFLANRSIYFPGLTDLRYLRMLRTKNTLETAASGLGQRPCSKARVKFSSRDSLPRRSNVRRTTPRSVSGSTKEVRVTAEAYHFSSGR